MGSCERPLNEYLDGFCSLFQKMNLKCRGEEMEDGLYEVTNYQIKIPEATGILKLFAKVNEAPKNLIIYSNDYFVI